MKLGEMTFLVARILSATVLAVALFGPSAFANGGYKVLHNFGAPGDGSVPGGAPLLGSKGDVYGVAGGGTGQCSDYGCGIAYKLMPQTGGTWEEMILHNFAGGADGSAPYGSLVIDPSGNLYGTTVGDGRFDVGGVFELSPGGDGWTNTIIYSQGAGPGLLLDDTGGLYGEMGPGDYFGLGALGELSPGLNGWTYRQLYSFTCQPSCSDGYGPPDPPIWDSKGNLWGTMTFGGITKPPCYDSNGCGVIYGMTPNGDGSWTYHVVHRFGSFPTDGLEPYSGLAMDTSGNFYGATLGGGRFGYGTIFRFAFTEGRWGKTEVLDLPNLQNGLPNGTLALDAAGNLYGAAGGGNYGCGPYTCGFVFKLAPLSNGRWKYSVLHNFSGPDGEFPVGVTVDAHGNVFGTTQSGGTYNAGVAFEISP